MIQVSIHLTHSVIKIKCQSMMNWVRGTVLSSATPSEEWMIVSEWHKQRVLGLTQWLLSVLGSLWTRLLFVCFVWFGHGEWRIVRSNEINCWGLMVLSGNTDNALDYHLPSQLYIKGLDRKAVWLEGSHCTKQSMFNSYGHMCFDLQKLWCMYSKKFIACAKNLQ